MISLSGKERVVVFGVGFLLGIVLIGFIHQRRAAQGPEGTESMAKKVIRDVISSTGVRPLPEETPDILRKSKLYSFDIVTSTLDGSTTTVWNLQMLEGMWPWVRVSEQIFVEEGLSPRVMYVAGDRLLITLKTGISDDQLTSALDTLGLEEIGYYKQTQQYVIGVEPGLPLALDFAISRLKSYEMIVESADFHRLTHF